MAKINAFKHAFAFCVQKTLWPTKIYGAENFDDFKGGILISNHYNSTPDAAIIFNKFFKNYFNALVKKEAFSSKIGNWFLSGIGCIPVKRGEPDIDAYKRVMKVLKSNQNILIFPEGTRNKTNEPEKLAPFKEGVSIFAVRAHCEILPMLYYRKHKAFRKNILLVGKPIDLEALGYTRNDSKQATDYLYEVMQNLRVEVNKLAKENKLCK